MGYHKQILATSTPKTSFMLEHFQKQIKKPMKTGAASLPRTKQQFFVKNSQTPSCVQEDDVVLIAIPEDLQITQAVDSALDKKLGRVKKILPSQEAELELITSRGHQAYSSTTVVVPLFCICLEEHISDKRLSCVPSFSSRYSLAHLEHDSGIIFG